MPLCLVLAGCGQQGDSSVDASSPSEATNLWGLADSAVIFKVNGRAFTKGDFMGVSRMYDRINRLNAGDDLDSPNKAAERAVYFRAPQILSDSVRREMVKSYAAELKVEPDDEDLKAARRGFESGFRRRHTLEQIAEKIGPVEGRIMFDYVRGDATDIALRRKFDVDHTFNITDADIMVVSNRIIRFNETAAISNAFEKSVLEKALADIRNGGAFPEVAKKYSIAPEDGKSWDSFTDLDFDDNAAVYGWVQGAKVGDVSGILESDEGWVLVKLVDKNVEWDGKEKAVSSEWSLVRIIRPLWEKTPEMTRDEIVAGVLKYRHGLVQKRVGAALMAHTVVEWPFGTNVLERLDRPYVRRSVTAGGCDFNTKGEK